MRFEILAKRIAKNTNTPILEDVLLGNKDITELPRRCMVWSGAIDHKIPRHRFRAVKDRPFPVVKYKKKKVGVRRLLFEHLAQPDYEFVVENACDNPLCVNPLHWTIRNVDS